MRCAKIILGLGGILLSISMPFSLIVGNFREGNIKLSGHEDQSGSRPRATA